MSTRRILSAAAALAAVFLLPATVSAAPPPGTITIVDSVTGTDNLVNGQPVVCEFAVELDFDVDEPVPVVAWVIKVWAESAFDGTTVLSGDDGPTTADGQLRQPRDGWVTLPDGVYNLLVDDEVPVDKSYLRQKFTVDCEDEATPAPTATAAPTVAPTATAAPTEAPTATPTDAPGGAVLPTEGTPTQTPAGEVVVLPAEGEAAATLPPTDTVDDGTTSGSPIALIVGLLLVGALGILGIMPARGLRER